MKIEIKALDTYVLAVAKEDYFGNDWSAYIAKVPGKQHDAEYQEVLAHGTKIEKAIAEAMFPRWKNKLYRE